MYISIYGTMSPTNRLSCFSYTGKNNSIASHNFFL